MGEVFGFLRGKVFDKIFDGIFDGVRGKSEGIRRRHDVDLSATLKKEEADFPLKVIIENNTGNVLVLTKIILQFSVEIDVYSGESLVEWHYDPSKEKEGKSPFERVFERDFIEHEVDLRGKGVRYKYAEREVGQVTVDKIEEIEISLGSVDVIRVPEWKGIPGPTPWSARVDIRVEYMDDEGKKRICDFIPGAAGAANFLRVESLKDPSA